MAWGEKRYETRSWSTQYRGLLAIHAAKRKPTDDDILSNSTRFRFVAQAHRLASIKDLPLGDVLCVARLVDCLPTSDIGSETWDRLNLTPQEYVFGDFHPRRFAWKLELVEVFDPPIPARGAQGLWEWQRP